MQNKTGKMGIIKTENPSDIDSFFGKKNEKVSKEWMVNIVYTAEEEEIVRKGRDALPRKNKAMRDYQKECVLTQAKKDIEKGALIKKTLEELE